MKNTPLIGTFRMKTFAKEKGNQMQIAFNDPHTGEPRILTTEDHEDGTTDVLVKSDDGTIAQSLHLPTETWKELIEAMATNRNN